MPEKILEVINLKKHFSRQKGFFSALGGKDGTIPAVDDISFHIHEGETMGLVGESGCGKTTIGRVILKLTPSTSGRILFEGQDITDLGTKEFRPFRQRMQMMFQDLDAALNPKMRIREILKEAITVFQRPGDDEIGRKTNDLLEQVNLKKSKLSNFPHELSGGEKRRVGIARVLAVGARFIVADEPTSALDVSIQAQVVNLLHDLQKTLGLSFLFISHDLRVVELISRNVAVMYLGKIVETGPAERVAKKAKHPYTHILWSSLVEKQNREATAWKSGQHNARWGVFDFERPETGCRFVPRCPVFESNGRPGICTDPASEPQLSRVAGDHMVACHFPL